MSALRFFETAVRPAPSRPTRACHGPPRAWHAAPLHTCHKCWAPTQVWHDPTARIGQNVVRSLGRGCYYLAVSGHGPHGRKHVCSALIGTVQWRPIDAIIVDASNLQRTVVRSQLTCAFVNEYDATWTVFGNARTKPRS